MNVFEEETPKEVAARLKNLCDSEGIDQHRDLVLDLYVLCANAHTTPVPNETLLEGLISTDPKYWQERVEVTKRKEFLERLGRTQYVQSARKLGDPMKAVLILIDALKKAKAANAALAGKSLTNLQSGHFAAAMGGKDGEQMLDLLAQGGSKSEDEDSLESGNVSLQGLGQDEFMSAITDYTTLMENRVAAAFVCGCGVGDSNFFTEVPGAILSKEIVDKALSLDASVLAFFKLFTAECSAIGSGNTAQVSSADVTPKRQREQMEEFSEVATVDPLEMAREGFDQKLAEKKLEVDRHRAEETGKCHVFVLLDVSGSMMTDDVGPTHICRAFAANVLTLALLNLAMRSGWMVHVVPFAGNVNEARTLHATDQASAIAAARTLGTFAYDGSDTKIERAILYAYKELGKDPTYKKCDIVLLTDGFSAITRKVVNEKPPKTKLRTILLTSAQYGSHSQNLKDASDSKAILGYDKSKGVFTAGNALAGINNREDQA